MHPNIKSILQKFDRKLIERYVEYHIGWYNGGVSPKKYAQKHKFLHDNVGILQTLWPLEEIPKILYRGMWGLKEYPRRNQPVFYSNKYSYVSSWTINKDTVYDGGFCYGDGEGILLTLNTSVMIGKAKFILWPIPILIAEEFYRIAGFDSAIGYIDTSDEREYAVWINQTIPIVRWGRC